jgi:uncharacterized protein YqjF (DUF2071 family)
MLSSIAAERAPEGFERLTTISVEVRNFALITYAVPVERVRRRLPGPYTLETFPKNGQEQCLVSGTCFCNHDFKWSAAPRPRLTFDEGTYRVYVTHRGRRGVYFFRRFLSSPVAFGAQRVADRNVAMANFDTETRFDDSGYGLYTCSVRSGDVENSFTIRARGVPRRKLPFASGEELAQHITYRLHGFFETPIGLQGHMPVSHRRMAPWSGELVSGRFDTWTQLGIVSSEEAAHPYSVLIEPAVNFLLHPPRPLV